ncbi:MAG: hypothetical protein WCI51_09885 [Lentisphaerota bacterium]
MLCAFVVSAETDNNSADSPDKAAFYPPDSENMKKYSQLRAQADLYLYFEDMRHITVGREYKPESLQFDIWTLKKYIAVNVKSKELVYIVFSKCSADQYYDSDGPKQLFLFLENYFAEFGFKRLIIEQATNIAGCLISLDKVITPANSKAQSKTDGK